MELMEFGLAIEGIALDYTVKFPLSLIISRRAVLHYQLLFRFLLHLKHAEQALTDMWCEHKSPPWSSRSGHLELERWKLRVVLLRTKMLAFVQQVLAFATGDILEPSWRSLEGKLAKAAKEGSQGTVDQLLRDHQDFLNTCMKGCLLTTSRFLKVCSMHPIFVLTDAQRYSFIPTWSTQVVDLSLTVARLPVLWYKRWTRSQGVTNTWRQPRCNLDGIFSRSLRSTSGIISR